MQPTSIVIHNFKSIGHIELDLTKFKDKSVLIQATNHDESGSNSNRSGKSNFMKAFMWGLFGVSTIEGTTDEIIQYGETNCYVIIRFGHIEIERRLKGKTQTFFYRIDGKDHSDSNKDAESLFLQDVGLDSKNKAIISNSIYLNSSVDNLINSTAGDRLKTLTEWFDLSRYDKAVEYARTKYKEWNTELLSITTQLEQAEKARETIQENAEKLMSINDNITYLQNDKKELEESQKVYDNYHTLEGNLFLLEEKLEEIHKENKDILIAKDIVRDVDISLFEKRKEQLTEALAEYNREFDSARSEIAQLSNQIVNPYTCPHCKSSLVINNSELVEVSVEANESIKKRIEELKNKLSKIKKPESTVSIDNEMREYYRIKLISEKPIKSTDELEEQIEELKAKLADKPVDYSFELKQTDKKLMDLSFIKGEIQSSLSFAEGEIEKIPSLKERSDKLTELCRLSLLWAGERNKVGIFQELKALTFTRIIRNLSLYVNNILTNHFYIQSQIKIESTSKGIEIYQVVNNEEHPVTSMSSGERARVAFALALALKKFYSTKLDILLADEFFGSLDSVGMEFVIKTMNTFSGMKFLISHSPCESEYVINLEKKDGVTYVR